MKIKPLGTRVVIKPDSAETVTASGIIIPDSAKEKQQTGKVVAVGDGTVDDPMHCKVGNTVLFGKFAGTEITIDSDELLIMGQSDILAIL